MTASGAAPYRLHASVVVRDRGRILLVREGKEAARGLWNFPGGHVEDGETIAAAAERELREETGLGVYLTDLVGIYNGPLREVRSLRFVYAGHAVTGTAAPGDDILEARWLTSREMGALPPEEVVAPSIFRRIVSDLETGLTWPTRVVTEE